MAALDAKGVTLHCTGSGPPLVLLHCLGADHKFWDFTAALSDKFTLLRYDLPGQTPRQCRTIPIRLRICPSGLPRSCTPTVLAERASPAFRSAG